MNKHKFYGAFLAFATVASVSMGAQAEVYTGLVVQNGYGDSRVYAYCDTATIVNYQCYGYGGKSDCQLTRYNCADYRNDYTSPGGLYGWVWRTCVSMCSEPTQPVAQPISPGIITPPTIPISITPEQTLPSFDLITQVESVY